MNTYWTEAT